MQSGAPGGAPPASSFWRRGAGSGSGGSGGSGGGSGLPGRPHAAASFKDFQESVRDAWEVGDDDYDEAASISRVISLTAAWNVIDSHSKRQQQQLQQEEDEKRQPPQAPAPPQQQQQQQQRNERPQPPPPHQHHHHQRHYPGRPEPVRAPTFAAREDNNYESKLERFQQLKECEVLDLNELKQLSWSGVPVKVRAVTWRLLSGYLPANAERRQEVLDRKRLNYWDLVNQYYEAERDDETYRQIHIDIPRMSPLVSLFQQTTVQTMFERILYIWAIRHPASGYVQGINDLVTPFFMVFLQEVVPIGEDLDNWQVDSLTEEQRRIIEADSFWCLSKFLDSIQDNYIFAQLGIQHKVNQLKELIRRIDLPLHQHLQTHGVDYLQFSFRWMNNLLTRELPLSCTIRLWDTYLAESDGFAIFQLYVCAAFLLHWRDKLMKEKDFQGLMILLQNVPTQNWQDSHIGMLVAEAYRLKFAFADAPNHLQSPANSVPQNTGGPR